MENEILDNKDMPNFEDELLHLIREEKDDAKLREVLSDYHENDIAGAWSKLKLEERQRLYRILGPEEISDIFIHLDDAELFIKEFSMENAAHIIENMDADDALDLLEDMDVTQRNQLMELMDQDTQEDIRLIASYDDDQVGSIMTNNYIEVRAGLSVKQAMKELVEQAAENDNISTLYVVNQDETFYGAIELTDLIIAREYTSLEDIISTSYPYVHANEQISECIERLKDYGEDSIPVLNEENKLIGVITAQNLVEVVDDELGDDYAKFAGLTSEEELNEPLLQSMKKRLPWLIILLGLGIVVSTVVGMFEQVVAQLALVVCFQSLILDMAGNVGTQSLAVTIRVLMDENLTSKQKLTLTLKEMRIGFSNGLILGVASTIAIGFYIMLAKQQSFTYAFATSACVGLSLIVAMLISSLVGTVIPLFFHKINIDPAVASGPLITTVNDLIAVVTYYGLAWWLLIGVLGLAS